MKTSILRRSGRFLLWLFAGIGVAGILANAVYIAGGIAARPRPSSIEERLARTARHYLIPAAARRAPNPVAATPELLASARAHFADHCATCHGNDGRGDTAHGRRMFPRAPDMTAPATQQLSDGELFWIIENGVKLTGMPGFGDDDPSNDSESWKLVHFIRSLPTLGEEELAEMERLNPTLSRADVERESAAEAFLTGSEPPAEEHEHHH